MAEKVVQKVEEQLNCSICLDTYTDPKLLQCFHAYCRKCLVRLVVRDQQGQLTLTCPICRQVTPVPANGVAGLQTAFHINNLLEIMEEHKKAADQPQSQESAPKSQAPQKKMLTCSVHDDKAELFCETCGELICLKCITRGGKHQDHDHNLMEQAFQRYKREISPSFEPMEHQLAILKQALAQLDTRCEEISHQQAAVEADVHKNFDRLKKTLDNRRTELISQLHKIAQAKKKALAAQRDLLETLQAQLSSSLTFVRESFKTGSEGEVLIMKTTIVKKVEKLTVSFKPDLLKPDAQADIEFSVTKDIISAMCKNYGQVLTTNSPDPSKCDVSMKDAKSTTGEKSTAVLKAVNYLGLPCSEASNSLKCELVSKITGAKTTGSIESRGRGQYEISYQPTIKGRHQLHVKVEGQHIRGSPFSVTTKAPVEKLGTPILTIGGVEEPYGVAITQRGEVVVTEWGTKHCVSVFSPSGDKLRSFGSLGSGQGQCNSPSQVAVDSEGNILAADWLNDRIQKFTVEGQFLTAVGTKGAGPLQFSRPYGIAVNSANNKVYVVESGNNCVKVLNSDLTFSSTFGKQGSGKGQFKFPRGIACDSSGNVYVADRNNHRVQVFTAEGKFLRMFGRRGEGRGELNTPYGVAIDTSDMVYVTDNNNHCVCVFTSEGEFVTSFGQRGEGFTYPYGVAVDSSGVVYVCDRINNCVQFF